MPRAVLKVQGAANKTRWTLARSNDSTPTRQSFHVGVKEALQQQQHYHHQDDSERRQEAADTMQAPAGHHPQPNGFHFHDDQSNLPRYSYDGSQYSEQSARLSSQGPWKAPQSVNPSRGVSNSNSYSGFDFNMSSALDDPRASNTPHRISVNTGVRNIPRSAPTHQDPVSHHLLYETALMDSQSFEILDIAEVDALKKEHVRLNQKIEATQRKLALESKVRDAAQNLTRLYSTKNRPDTPQDPDSPKKSRHSLLNGRARSSSRVSMGDAEHFQQADNELAASVRKVDELHAAMKELLDRRQYVERKLLRHTSAVLAEEANRNAESAVPGVANGHRGLRHDVDDEDGVYTPNEFDGIRDILRGMPAGAGGGNVRQHEEQLESVQQRLEQLNFQLRAVIDEAGRSIGQVAGAEVPLDDSQDSAARVENRFARLEDSLHALQRQQDEVKTHHSQAIAQQDQTRDAVEQQLHSLNSQLHNALLAASESQAVPGLQQPPQSTGQGYDAQMQYLEDNIMTMEQLLQLQHQSGATQKLSEYETTIHGLWDILQPDGATRRPSNDEDDDDDDEPPTSLNESFSLPAFSSLVQTHFDRAQSAKVQHDILRRQIQQQRDLNGKSDAEKDREIASWQGKHDELVQNHSAMQQELANWIVKQESTESEASHSRAELERVMQELEALKGEIDAKLGERDEVARKMREQVDVLETRAKEQESVRSEMEELEGEVVRLTTELTMAKAELDGAYGSRQERKGAQAAEVSTLTERNRNMSEQLAQLERELSEMTVEFQELTRESIELEKEREGLDNTIDGLREKCEGLEVQLGEEKLRWAGIRSPTGGGGGEAVAKEGTSMMVLRQEFKKMMRDQRAEGVRLLRSEQEERRRLESELRKLRQSGGPLGKRLESASGTATPV